VLTPQHADRTVANWSLDCTQDSAATYATGGPAFYGYRASSAVSAHYLGRNRSGTSITNPIPWTNPGRAITTCSGAEVLGTALSGQTWTLTMVYSTTGLDADSTKGCADLSYTETGTLCTCGGQ
jgi:hypothetical protein